MSRSIESDGRDPACKQSDPHEQPGQEPARGTAADLATLRTEIDRATEGSPTFSEFIQRLEGAGIRALPSLQRSGRLNGMSYERNGWRVKGSELGRPYTALGLEKRKGLRYDGERDRASLERACQAGRQAAREPAAPSIEEMRPDRCRADRDPPDLRDRSDRLRLYEALSVGERDTLREIGQFRAVQVEDLIRIRYRDDRAAWRQDGRRLEREKLIERRSVVVATHAKGGARARDRALRTLSVVVLTKKGKELLKRCDVDMKARRQTLYAGFVKPREIAHDTAIYRLFRAEAARIQKEGGRISRVILDFELKRRAYSPLGKVRKHSDGEYRRKQAEVARENDLAVVGGKIRFPDLRIEYLTARGDPARVDLELATEHYRGEHMATKSQAGFKICAERASFPGAGGSSGRGGVYDHHRIDVFSF